MTRRSDDASPRMMRTSLQAGSSTQVSSVSDSEYLFLYLSSSCELLTILGRDPSNKKAKIRCVMSAHNIAQQTNALDVNKHMSTLPLSSSLHF